MASDGAYYAGGNSVLRFVASHPAGADGGPAPPSAQLVQAPLGADLGEADIRIDAVRVMFNEEQMRHAAEVGSHRRIRAMLLGRKGRYGIKNATFDGDIYPAAAEKAACGYYGITWITELEVQKNGVKIADGVALSGAEIDVKSCLDHDGRLIVHPDDVESRAYVLVTGGMQVHYIQGWIEGGRAKRTKWEDDPTGERRAYFVPQAALHSPETLHEWLEEPERWSFLNEPVII